MAVHPSHPIAAILGVVAITALTACAAGSPPATSSAPTGEEFAAPSLIAPDTRFLYQYGPGFEAGGDLFVMNGDGSDPVKLDIDLPRIRISHSDPSRDGEWIAFGVDNENDQREIWVSRPDGVTDRRLLVPCQDPTCLGSDYASWSPDGTEIAYTYFGLPGPFGPPESSTIRIVDVATGEWRIIATSEPGELVDYARWSPDATQIVLEIDRFTEGVPTDSFIGIVPVTGGVPVRITGDGMRAGYPDWSPDGERISFATNMSAFFVDQPITSNIYTIRPDGTEVTQLTDFPLGDERATQPTWLVDGSGIVFTWEVAQQQYAAIVPVDGGAPLKISTSSAAHVRQIPAG